jgi:hypothetical protein
MSEKITRREALKRTLFGAATLALPITIEKINNEIESGNIDYVSPKSRKPGAITLAFGDIYGSKDFPLRDGDKNPRSVMATDGARIYFLWPSERGDARGYILRNDEPDAPEDDRIVFRLRMGKPEPPYYLRWRKGDYYLYTPPGALIKRASYFIKQDNDNAKLQALSDMRMAIMINLTHIGSAQKYLDRMCEIDNAIRTSTGDLKEYWNDYKNLLTETNPNG